LIVEDDESSAPRSENADRDDVETVARNGRECLNPQATTSTAWSSISPCRCLGLFVTGDAERETPIRSRRLSSTRRDLSPDDETPARYSKSIIIKGAKSPERLLDR